MPDGTFHIDETEKSDQPGSLKWIKDGVEVSWRNPRETQKPGPEQWQVRGERDHLFITREGETVEYVRAPVQ
jgi:hypothetical protein